MAVVRTRRILCLLRKAVGSHGRRKTAPESILVVVRMHRKKFEAPELSLGQPCDPTVVVSRHRILCMLRAAVGILFALKIIFI